jgi:hypothetical protein
MCTPVRLRLGLARASAQYACMSNESNPPKQRGCLFYGCLSLSILGLLAIVLGVVAYFWVKSTTARWIRDYTDTAPAPIEKVQYSPAQMDALNARVAAFKDALEKGKGTTELVLTAEDLNALIAKQKDLADRLFIRMDEDNIKGDISFPLPDIGPFKLKGRYLNGTAAFKVALENGSLDVRLQDVLVKGKPLPGVFFNELKKQNLAKDAQQDPQTAGDIQKFESIRITNSSVILRNKVAGPP